MQPGQILVAEHGGVFVIKMKGDVRLTLCISFDQFIDDMFAHPRFKAVLFDLSGPQANGSTTLGLMAKISLLGEERNGRYPVILSSNESINRVLDTMGFADIFTIVKEFRAPVQPTAALGEDGVSDEDRVKNKVIEAHRYLMQLNEANEQTFTDLVNMLENDQ